MFERPGGGERALLVHLRLQQAGNSQPQFPEHEFQDRQREFEELCVSAGCEIVDTVTASRDAPDPRYFIGRGKAEDIRAQVSALHIELVIFNHQLSPGQERNLEALLKCRVLDRTGLILDIFAQRARSFEGKLQVELAQLKHLSTRLIRGWTHLERQKGGIGLRGPGETQLETDRRLIGARIKQLKQRLQKYTEQRNLGSRARRRAMVPAVSLVGYTNAGKSTLFNSMTESEVLAADQLFATLDPTVRRVSLPADKPIVLADTVGFIRHLPHDLVAAFRSTLTETRDADLLLHVVDAASEERQANIEQVNNVLKEIGAEDRPQLMVYNKIDLLDKAEARIENDDEGLPAKVWVSALSGDGLDLLSQAIEIRLYGETVEQQLCLPPSEGRLSAKLHELGAVREEHYDEQGNWLINVLLQRRDWNALCKNEQLEKFIVEDSEALRLAVGSEGP